MLNTFNKTFTQWERFQIGSNRRRSAKSSTFNIHSNAEIWSITSEWEFLQFVFHQSVLIEFDQPRKCISRSWHGSMLTHQHRAHSINSQCWCRAQIDFNLWRNCRIFNPPSIRLIDPSSHLQNTWSVCRCFKEILVYILMRASMSS